MKILLHNSKRFIFLLLLMQTLCFGATITSTATGGNWSAVSTWVGGVVPSYGDDVVIASGSTVTVNMNAEAKSIVIVGELILATSYKLIVYGDFTVAASTGSSVPAGNFKIKESGSSTTTLIVLGNYINNGITDFDKGDVIIVGNLTTPATSTLQNLGNVIVGGDISGDFNLQGSIQTNQQIYAVNPNATVTITPDKIDVDVVPGTPVTTTTESSTLVGLVDLYIYGGSCNFTVNNISNFSACSGSNAQFTVSTPGTSPQYKWQVNINGSGWVDLTGVAPYSGVTTSTLNISGVTVTMNNYKYRAKITAGSPTCTKNGNYGVLTVNAAPTTPTITAVGSTTFCSGGSVTLTSSAGTTYLWSTGATTQSISPTTVGSYTVQVTNASGCQSTASLDTTVTVNALPVITIQPTIPTATCSGIGTQTISVTATGTGLTYSWRKGGLAVVNGGVISGQGTATLILTNPLALDAGSYDVLISGTCTPAVLSNAVTVTVNGLPVAATLNSNSPICSGSNAVFTITGTAGNTVTYTGAASGTAIIGAGGTVNVVVSAVTTNTTLNLTNVNNSTCNQSISATATVSVNTVNKPILSPVTQLTCTVATGSFTITNYNSNYTYAVNPSTGVTVSGNTITAPAGSYTVTATLGSCISAESLIVSITSPDKTWNGSISEDWNDPDNWTPSGVPTSSNCVTIPSATKSPIISGTNVVAYANNLTILTSGALTVESSNTLTVTDFVDVDLGFLNFENTASLVQINNVATKANSGFIDYQRITAARKTDYTYWSSPVTPMTFEELYPMGGTFYSYEATAVGEDWSSFDAGTEMVAGKGYIANQGAEIPSVAPPSDELDVTFTGVPNNGNITIPVLYTGIDSLGTSNLIGNPYPSALDADKFLAFNSSVLDGTLYFWTHNTAIQDATNIGANPDGSPKAGSGAYAYTSDDYATYNFTGGAGTGTGIGNFENGTQDITNIPTGKIASGQGFFATGIAAGTITFNNDMRVGVIDILEEDNSQFFKTRNPTAKTTKTIQKNRVWLNLTNTQGAFKQTLIGYVTDATNDFDSCFDGESFDGNEFVDFYSLNQDKNLVIQGRALPFDATDEVPLGFRTTINGAFTINIDQVDGLLTNQAVFIEDKLTNTVFNLKSGNYTFNTVAGTFNDRFVLRYKDNSTAKTLATANFDSLEKTVLVSSRNKQIKIDSSVESIDKIAIFDLLGRQIYQKDKVNSNELSITLTSIRQTLVVKVMLQNGKTISKKIIF
jgi:hypothetical protein